MFEVSIGGERFAADVTFGTAHLYEAEFMRDLVADFYGRQEIDVSDAPDSGVVTLDFTKVRWSAIMRALWAAIKTADPGAPPYEKWLAESRGVDSLAARELLDEAISDCFFRSEAAEEDG